MAPEAVAPKPTQEAEQPRPRTAPAPRPRKPKPAPKPAALTEPEGVDNVAAYLPPDVLRLVRAEKARRVDGEGNQPTYDELLAEALANVTVDQLRAAYTTARTDADGLMPTRSRARRKSGTIQVQLRLDGPQRAALEELKDEVSAPSRSALVAAAFALHLRRAED